MEFKVTVTPEGIKKMRDYQIKHGILSSENGGKDYSDSGVVFAMFYHSNMENGSHLLDDIIVEPIY